MAAAVTQHVYASTLKVHSRASANTGLAECMFAFPGFLQLLCKADISVYYNAYETLNGP